jgi:hypothetical protein
MLLVLEYYDGGTVGTPQKIGDERSLISSWSKQKNLLLPRIGWQQ